MNKTKYECYVDSVLSDNKNFMFYCYGTKDEALIYTIRALRKLFFNRMKKHYNCKPYYYEKISTIGYSFKTADEVYWNAYKIQIVPSVL